MGRKTRHMARKRRHQRVRKHISGTSEKPRLNVFRSLTGIYGQIIDDRTGHTLVSASSNDQKMRKEMSGMKKSEMARVVGQTLAERALAAGIKEVVFDRGGYRYQGRVRALAEAAREGGLQF